MTGFFRIGMTTPFMLRTEQVPAADRRGAINNGYFTPYSRQSLPTDAVGTVKVTITGVKAGTEVKVIDQSLNVVAGTDSSSGDPQLVLSVYAPGSPNNVVRILVIALGYEVIDFNYILPTTDSTIPVFQRIDRTYKNPTESENLIRNNGATA